MYITFSYLSSSPKTSINSKWMNFYMEFYTKGTQDTRNLSNICFRCSTILVCLGKMGFTLSLQQMSL